ncbi:MAG: single-stranded-DNA-specific exonuclease RecJ [Lachnospiraceae bacterium]|nr:single-stranded-DNA-specific exonuclease RecJ [Lachnospiraceae bacterium]
MARWMVYAKGADFQKIAEEFHISPVLARILRNREVITDTQIRTFLHGTAEDLHLPALLPDAEKAAGILADKIKSGKKICVIGDYDVDGICAAHILTSVLHACGGDAEAVLPDRIVDGYGMNQRMVTEAAARGIDTILTCDNGISATLPIKVAGRLGLTVIVTDHHEVPFQTDGLGRKRQILPPAAAVVNPKIENAITGRCDYPYPDICGAVVAHKLMELLLDRMQIPEGDEILRSLLPFAALATVCDVMPLADENRIIVREGLGRMQDTKNAGLSALLKVTGLGDKPISAYHAGYILGPCLNASGRLDNAIRAFRLFQHTSYAEALLAAQELKDLNDSRKGMTQKGMELAVRSIETGHLLSNDVLVVYLPSTHESLAGIIAGRLREKYGCPCFVLTDTEDGLIKGSGRSIEAYNMYEELSGVSDLLIRFGGHPMAAGLTMEKQNLPVFIQRINAQCRLTEEDMEEVLHIDMELPPSLLTLDMVKEFRLLEPCGRGNPRPVFAARDITVTALRVMGRNENALRIDGICEDGTACEFVYFSDPGAARAVIDGAYGEGRFDALKSAAAPAGGEEGAKPMRIKIAYCPDINEWNGRERLQFIVRDMKA